ncbi:MAG: diaminopimelate epimerase [Bacteroidetes bacterium]|nr:diaminopimelate epimerase [Bacteroidota bacterium]MDA1118971.1 diaminopimelate epimerase [Bacteroidota bacterium]
MELHFYKYQGTGNDFVIVDNREINWRPDNQVIALICDRRFGVGADGLMLLQNHPEFDFEMIYFNSDGSKSLCGNGSRCAIHLAHQLGIIGSHTTFLTTDGVHTGSITDERVSFQIFDLPDFDLIDKDYFIDNGSPHYVRFVDDVEKEDVFSKGKAIRNESRFSPGGTNVNFVEIIGGSEIFVRTYERGVEDETLSCGTGVTAAALAATHKGLKSPIKVRTPGGELSVNFDRDQSGFKRVFLSGPAVPVFEGKIMI